MPEVWQHRGLLLRGQSWRIGGALPENKTRFRLNERKRGEIAPLKQMSRRVRWSLTAEKW